MEEVKPQSGRSVNGQRQETLKIAGNVTKVTGVTYFFMASVRFAGEGVKGIHSRPDGK